LDNFEILPLDTTIYAAQAAKGKNLQCFVGRKEIKGDNTVNDFRKKSVTQFCLGFICRTFLNDRSEFFKCSLVDGVCSRTHFSKEEVKTNSKEVASCIENSKFASLSYKAESLERLKNFVENE
jgi:hypothetical protein